MTPKSDSLVLPEQQELKEIPPSQPDSPPVKSLVGKLADAFANVGGLEKKGKNTAQNYPYLKAADVAKAVRMELFNRGIIMATDVESAQWSEFQTMKGSRMSVCRITARFTFYDSEGDSTVSFRGVGEAFDTGDKACYKATTGALKYALRTSGLIPDEKDDPEADERVDREMAEDGADVNEAKVLAKFEEREKAQPRVVPDPPKVRQGEGWVVLTKIEKAKAKNGAEFWTMHVTDHNQQMSKVSVWDKKLMTADLWSAGGKDLKIKITSKDVAGKIYYNLAAIYVIGSKEVAQTNAGSDFDPEDQYA